MKLNRMELIGRELEGNMYVYSYKTDKGAIVKVAKLIPVMKELVVKGNGNNIVLPVVPEKITIEGDNNSVIVEDKTDDLEVPFFLSPQYKQAVKAINKAKFAEARKVAR
jgi:hypothetical protein